MGKTIFDSNRKKSVNMKKGLALGAMVCALGLFAACGDNDNSNLIIGTWGNTAQSYETTIAGTKSVSEDMICMEFTADSVRISDVRCNCIPKWEHYTLTNKDGKQILIVGNDTYGGYVVEELSSNKMVLTSPHPDIDMAFAYTMSRRR